MVRARGYILAETLVALIVLALVLGALLQVTVESARRQRAALETRAALVVARSAMAQVGVTIPARPGATTGTDGGVAWTVAIEDAGAGGSLGLVRVRVGAGPPGARARVRLTELRLVPR